MFETTSRYYTLPTSTYAGPDGREIKYVQRRFLPDSSTMVDLAQHVVAQGDRLDNVTARYLSDPEQFWRVCDANDAMRPDDLTARIGARLRIPYPQP